MAKKDDLTTLGKTIKKGMIDSGINQTQLAEKVGSSPSFPGHIMHGRRPGKAYLPKIAAILGIDLNQLEENEAAS